MKLEKLTLVNFKGIPDFTLQLNGQNATVYGANGSGKTTLMDAYYWLLCGGGILTDAIDVRPCQSDGTPNTKVNPTVYAEFKREDGTLFTLKRTCVSKFAGREKTYTGDETKCEVNGVPCKTVREFEQFVTDEFGNKQVLKALTDIHYFPARLKPDERFAMCIALLGDIRDEDVFACNPSLRPLADSLNGLTVEQLQRKLKAGAKAVAAELNDIPGKINAHATYLQDSINIQAEKESLSKVQVQLPQLRRRLESGDEAETRRELDKQLRETQYQLSTLEEEWQASVERDGRQHEHSFQNRVSDCENSLSSSAGAMAALQSDIERGEAACADLKAQIAAKREMWKSKSAEVYQPSKTCPTCGQAYPKAMLDEAEGNWNELKANDLARIQQEGRELAARLDAYQTALSGLWEKQRQCRQTMKKVQTELDRLKAGYKPYQPSDSALAEYNAKRDALATQAAAIADKIEACRSGHAAQDTELRQRIAELERQRDQHFSQIARAEESQKAKEHIAGLQARQKELLSQKDSFDMLDRLCDDFHVARVSLLDEAISSKFQITRFMMYEEKKTTDGLKKKCEPMGPFGQSGNCVPYIKASTSQQAALGMDITYAFGTALGQHLPIFVNNGESIMNNWGVTVPKAQVIRLVVSQQDKELRVQVTAP